MLTTRSKHSFAPSCRDFAQKLAGALNHNSSSGLTTINLANNPLEDRGGVPALTCWGCPPRAQPRSNAPFSRLAGQKKKSACVLLPPGRRCESVGSLFKKDVECKRFNISERSQSIQDTLIKDTLTCKHASDFQQGPADLRGKDMQNGELFCCFCCFSAAVCVSLS